MQTIKIKRKNTKKITDIDLSTLEGTALITLNTNLTKAKSDFEKLELEREIDIIKNEKPGFLKYIQLVLAKQIKVISIVK